MSQEKGPNGELLSKPRSEEISECEGACEYLHLTRTDPSPGYSSGPARTTLLLGRTAQRSVRHSKCVQVWVLLEGQGQGED